MRLSLILLCGLFALPAFAQRESFAEQTARRERLQKSAEQWAERQVIRSAGHVRISDYGVNVQEKSVVLPPNLGGPDPKNPLVQIQVQVWITGTQEDINHRGDWRDFNRSVRCEIKKTLWAKANRQGRPVSIHPGQTSSAPIVCVSGTISPDPYRRGLYP